jgi:sporulation protein YlmC with PRC-barrel domain
MMQRLLLTSALALALATPALAQEDQGTPQVLPEDPAAPAGDAATPDQPPTAQDQPAATPEQPPVQTGEPATDPAAPAEQIEPEGAAEVANVSPEGFITEQSPDQFRAERVIGASVTNSQDENIGSITDLVFDADQRIVGVVISVGGFLGIGDKWVAVPIDQVQLDPEQQIAMADLTSDELNQAPPFVTEQEQEAEAGAAVEQPMQPTAPAPQ